jgi:NADPH:quinone reductase-like Zn-dependent oxidoreductase
LPNQNPADGINYRNVPDWDRAVRELTGGHGADHVMELGGAGTLERSYRALAFGGRIASNHLKPPVDRVFAFNETVDALRYLGAGNCVGKVVIRV